MPTLTRMACGPGRGEILYRLEAGHSMATAE
jgi:hypothetical protein